MAAVIRRRLRSTEYDNEPIPSDVAGSEGLTERVDGPSDGTGGSGTGGTGTVNPADFTFDGSGEELTPTGRKKRKLGPRKAKSAGNSPALGVFAASLASVSIFLAAYSATPEVAIHQEEATAITQALDNLAQEYDLTASGKTAAWINLATTLGMVAGSHFVAYKIRTSQNALA